MVVACKDQTCTLFVPRMQRKSSRLSAKAASRAERRSEGGAGYAPAAGTPVGPSTYVNFGAMLGDGRTPMRGADFNLSNDVLALAASWLAITDTPSADLAATAHMHPAQLKTQLTAVCADRYAHVPMTSAQQSAVMSWLEEQVAGLPQASAEAPWKEAGYMGNGGKKEEAAPVVISPRDRKQQAAMAAAEGHRRLELAAPHPYLSLLLKQPLPRHIIDADAEWQYATLDGGVADDAGEVGEGARKGDGGSAVPIAAPSAPPSAAASDADVPASPLARSGSDPSIAGDAGTASASAGEAAMPMQGTAQAGATAHATERPGSGRGRGRGRRGRSAGSSGAAGRALGGIPRLPRLEEPYGSAAAAAVASSIASAPPEGSLAEQWELFTKAGELLANAPDDEVLAEILCLQVCWVEPLGQWSLLPCLVTVAHWVSMHATHNSRTDPA